MKSRRQAVTEFLETGPRTIREVSRELGIKVRTVLSDLEHIRLSLRNTDKELYIMPPYCHDCKKYIPVHKIKNIRKCPDCKSENVGPARFAIQEK